MLPAPLAARPLFALALIAAGCATTGTPSVPAARLEAPVWLGLAEAVVLDEAAVTFDGVVEDSRCPADVTCVRAGEARVRLLVGGTPVELVVRPGDSGGPLSADLHGLHIEALRLTPTPGTAAARAGDPPAVELAIGPARAPTAVPTDR